MSYNLYTCSGCERQLDAKKDTIKVIRGQLLFDRDMYLCVSCYNLTHRIMRKPIA